MFVFIAQFIGVFVILFCVGFTLSVFGLLMNEWHKKKKSAERSVKDRSFTVTEEIYNRLKPLMEKREHHICDVINDGLAYYEYISKKTLSGYELVITNGVKAETIPLSSLPDKNKEDSESCS
jgi:hypothetical protein